MNTCETCRFYEPGSGTCRTKPPQIIVDAMGEWLTQFPEVSDSDWCGKWEQPAKYHVTCDCGKVFDTDDGKRRYCSEQHQVLYRQRKYRETGSRHRGRKKA